MPLQVTKITRVRLGRKETPSLQDAQISIEDSKILFRIGRVIGSRLSRRDQRYTTFKQTTLSTQAAKTKRYHRQRHKRTFTERVFTPLNEQIDEDNGVVFYFSS